MAAPSNKQIKTTSVGNQSENTFLPSVWIVSFHISTQRSIFRHFKNRIWKYCEHSASQKPIIVLVGIFDFRAIHLSTWIASTCKHLGKHLRSERKHSKALWALALLNMSLVVWKKKSVTSRITLGVSAYTLQMLWRDCANNNSVWVISYTLTKKKRPIFMVLNLSIQLRCRSKNKTKCL